MDLTPEIVRIAYRLFFDRDPENEAVVRHALTYRTTSRLRQALLSSVEFEMVLARRPRLVRPDAPPLQAEPDVDEAEARALLQRLRAAWRDTPPGPPADAGALADPTGEVQAADLVACLRRAGIEPAALSGVFEFGCGGGRVTRHLAARFGALAACDLSPVRLAAAADAVAGDFVAVDDLRFGMMATFDLWYSQLALQSYPPPLITRILARALALLRPGGAAVFQVPTYGYGYRFDRAAMPLANPALDRHVLVQPAIFAIAAQAGCAVAEAFDDLSVTPNMLWRSTVFVLRKAQ